MPLNWRVYVKLHYNLKAMSAGCEACRLCVSILFWNGPGKDHLMLSESPQAFSLMKWQQVQDIGPVKHFGQAQGVPLPAAAGQQTKPFRDYRLAAPVSVICSFFARASQLCFSTW